jgi:hypothetical protein
MSTTMTNPVMSPETVPVGTVIGLRYPPSKGSPPVVAPDDPPDADAESDPWLFEPGLVLLAEASVAESEPLVPFEVPGPVGPLVPV